MVLSSLFILSPRGDAIISKDFRGDVPKSAIETFFRRVKLDKDAAPVLVCVLAAVLFAHMHGSEFAQEEEGVHFLHVKRGGLYFVATTKVGIVFVPSAVNSRA